MMSSATSAIVIHLAICLLLSTVDGNLGLTNTNYKREIGSYLIGTSYQRLMNQRLNFCVMKCSLSFECHYMNLINESSSSKTQCKFFNISAVVNTTFLIKSGNSTFYRKWVFKDCLEAKLMSKGEKSGKYQITLPYNDRDQAFCDMITDGGGWTLLQRRIDGSVDFNRDWQSYKIGFGNLDSEFWLGLEAAHLLTKDVNVTLRFDMWDGQTHYFREYYGVSIAPETDKYRLDWISSAGNTSESMMVVKTLAFSTKDVDNDLHPNENCASTKGGWWFKACHYANLNGQYGSSSSSGINWLYITGLERSLSKTEMKVKLNG